MVKAYQSVHKTFNGIELQECFKKASRKLQENSK